MLERRDVGVGSGCAPRRSAAKTVLYLGEINDRQKRITRDSLLMKLGAAQKDAGKAFGLMIITLPEAGQPINEDTFHWRINRAKYRQTYRREGRYLLRSNLPPDNPATLWEYYIQLTEIEEAFRNLKGDLAIRPIRRIQRSMESDTSTGGSVYS